MQYHYIFSNSVARYTIVAANYKQAERYASKVIVPIVCTYKGRWHGAPVKNGSCVRVTRI